MLQNRLDFLKQTQNADGGWGYFPGKRSWLEPTVYAALAMHADAQAEQQCRKTWQLLESWSLPDGGWRTSTDVAEPNWTSALAVTFYCVMGMTSLSLKRGVDYLLRTVGAEGSFLLQLGQRLNLTENDIDFALQGWPWHNGNSSWIEPTAHTILALKKAASIGDMSSPLTLRERVRVGEYMLLQRRCLDGGWNYGNRTVRGVAVPSYPETTAVALLGLQGHEPGPLAPSLKRAIEYWQDTKSPLAKAWLTICLRNYGVAALDGQAPALPSRPSQDIMLAALQSLAVRGGHEFLTASGGA